MRNACLLILALFAATVAHAQPGTFRAEEFFNGSVVYDIAYSGPNSPRLYVEEPKNPLDASSERKMIQAPPTRMAMHFHSDGHFIVQMTGGTFPKTILYNIDSNTTYVLDVDMKRAWTEEKYRVGYSRPPVARPTGDSIVVAGVVAYGYKWTLKETERAPASETIVYVSPRYRADHTLYYSAHTQAYFLAIGLEGAIPLKIIRTSQGITTTLTASRVIPQKFDVVQFTIPPGFKIVHAPDYRR